LALALVDRLPELRWLKVGLEFVHRLRATALSLSCARRGLRVCGSEFHGHPSHHGGAVGSAARLERADHGHACAGSQHCGCPARRWPERRKRLPAPTPAAV